MSRIEWERRAGALLCLLLSGVVAVGLLSCGGGGGIGPPASTVQTPTAPAPSNELTASEVQGIVQTAATSVDAPITVAVTNRAGVILAVYRKTGSPATSTGNFSQQVDTAELAVALARTGAFFSNDQAPLSSRTVRYISGVHFPPGIADTPQAALYGIENTNRGCPLNNSWIPGKSLPPARSIDGTQIGLGVQTGKADIRDSDPNAVNPGGVPIFKNGKLVGGIGVAGAAPDTVEYAAFTGSVSQPGFGPQVPPPGEVVVDSVALPFVLNTARPAGVNAGTFSGSFVVSPQASPGPPPEGDLVAPQDGIGGLTAADVRTIVDNSVATGNTIRALIRLPIGSRARFVIAVADINGNILGLNRMPDATIFSLDVAVAKARNMAYMASKSVSASVLPGVPPGIAISSRTIEFGAQPMYPPGIDNSDVGPFWDLYKYDVAHPCTNAQQPANPYQSGVVFFPGSTPLYKNGVLVGGLGISGDGVEQDDFASAGGSVGYQPDPSIRADQIIIRGVRLPFWKFPRNPTD